MGRQNRQVQRRLGAVAGKGMTDALQISPTTRSKARSTAFIRSSSSRPKGLLIFERGRVESLSTRSEEHTSELQSLMRISYAVFCLKKTNQYSSHKYSTNIETTTNVYYIHHHYSSNKKQHEIN